MVSFTVSSVAALSLSLASITTALPVNEQRRAAALNSNEFTLSLKADGKPPLTLNVLDSGTIGNLALAFERNSVYSGTPAYISSAGVLEFDTSSYDFPGASPTTPYGLYIEPTVGGQGKTTPVTAIFDNSATTGFSLDASTGELVYANLKGGQGFFACDATVDGQQQLALEFGEFEVGGASPEGCFAVGLELYSTVQ